MSKNYFSSLRKSYVSGTLLTTMLSNLMVFGQPMQQMMAHVDRIEAAKPHTATPKPILRPTINPKPKKELASPSHTFYAAQTEGLIGKSPSGRENITDNFFSIVIPDNLDLGNYQAVMAYDLYGLAQASHTTKSINGFPAYGGKIIGKTQSWTLINEFIPAHYLQSGANEIFFTRRVDENYQYKIKNMSIRLIEKEHKQIHLAEKKLVNFGGNLFVMGMVPNQPSLRHVEVEGKRIPVTNGVFETLLENIPKQTKKIHIVYQAEKNQKRTLAFDVRYQDKKTSILSAPNPFPEKHTAIFSLSSLKALQNFHSAGIALHKEYTGEAIPAQIKIEGLGFKDLRLPPNEMQNVTHGAFLSYRIKRNKAADTIPVQLHLKYDPAKIPDGYTHRDVKTFYYDKQLKSWKALPVDSLDLENNSIVSTLAPNPETDYINGIIKVPENPETAGFAPTAMSDIEFANPASGVVSIPPPSPNNMGSASTNFPIKLPQGRNGMQPSLAVSYSSEAGNGWMGVGWNLQIPAISLNTKWGVPTFDPQYESEIYSLNGEDLVLKNANDYTNPHRDDNISRSTKMHRLFFLRKEGSYLKITRWGLDPTNYRWIVEDKYGNKSFYGSDDPINGVNPNYVLKDPAGNIAHWALARKEDPYGNYVEYHYHNASTTVNSGGGDPISGKEFYIDWIRYTRHASSNSNYYQIDFERDIGRTDATINARNGFLQLTNDLLDEVVITLKQGTNTQTIRSYKFHYTTGPFDKSLLTKIEERDTNGNLFYSNTFEYYNEIGGSAVIPSQNTPWEGSSDNISSTLGAIAPGGLGIPNGSALGANVSDGFSAGLRAGAGLGINPISITLTIGGSYNYNQNTQEGRISFLDVNGDGLADKVYSNGSGVYYRGNTSEGFGNLIQIGGLDQLSRTKSRTNGWGADANASSLVSVGKSQSKTKTTTDNYFLDYNGDGLPDMISNNSILFNTTEAGADYTWRDFEGTGTGNTENVISPGNININPDHLDFETEEELRVLYPQFDHVKVWRAPYDGTVSIEGTAWLSDKNDCDFPPPPASPQDNEFRLTIEKANAGQTQGTTQTFSTRTLVTKGSSTTYNQNISVIKGDLLFFRVHNKKYGCGGQVEWNPEISYNSTTTLPLPNATDENGDKFYKVFDAQQDFMLNNGGSWSPHKADSSVDIKFHLPHSTYDPDDFSDQVDFVVEKWRVTYDNDGVPGNPSMQDKWVRTYQPVTGNFTGAGASGPITTGVYTSGGTYSYFFRFYVESDSNVQWDNIDWNPEASGTNTGTQYPSVSYMTYDENVNQTRHWIYQTNLVSPVIDANIPGDEDNPLMRLEHTMFSQNYSLSQFVPEDFPVKINWVTKEKTNGISKVLRKRTFYLHGINQNPILKTWTYSFNLTENPASTDITNDPDYYQFSLSKEKIQELKDNSGRIYSAFYVDNEKFATLNPADIILDVHPYEQTNYPSYNPFALQSPFMATPSVFFGIPYRGWGQFLYNGGLKGEYDNDYNIDNIESLAGDIQMHVFKTGQDAGQLENDIDAGNTSGTDMAVYYTLYAQDNVENRYENTSIIDALYGYDANNKLTASLGRFGEHNIYDIYVDPASFTSGSAPFIGLQQRSVSKGNAESGSFPGYKGTDSNSDTDLLLQYADLNGDRYPDLITKGQIQYSRMQGGLSSMTKGNAFVSGSHNHDETHGISVAGLQPNSDSKGIGSLLSPIILSTFAGISSGNGQTSDVRQWTDINGDGLADQVTITTSEVQVKLNTGYGFGNTIIWGNGYDNLVTSTRLNTSGGFSIPGTPSISVGFGATTGTANLKAALVDVNGDGLPDLVWDDNGFSFQYFLNTGIGFSGQAQTFYAGMKIDQNTSVSGNVFATVTAGFVIPIPFAPIKVTFSPSAGVSAAVDEKNIAVQDINGDGLPDVLSQVGDNNGSINAKLNRTGKTNLLKKVNLPLGGSWTVDYAKMGNTYDMPQHKWVMKEVKIHDGFAGDNSFDPLETITTFKYENGKYDRRDRSFFGFETLTTEQWLSTSTSGDPYRYTVKKYHNQDYYFKGMLKEAATYKGGDSNELLSRTQNFYNLFPATPPSGATEFEANANTSLDQPYIAPTVGELDRTRAFPALVKSIATTYEANNSLNLVQEFTEYDAYGNLTKYINRGTGPQDAYTTEISYGNSTYQGLPTEVLVKANGAPMRQRTAAYNSKGKLELITIQLNQNETNRVQLDYDDYGNTTSIIQLDNTGTGTPGGAETPFEQSIEYETLLHTYPIEFSDSFGQTSSAEYDYLFGMPVLITDMSNNKMRTRIDNRGRVVEVTSPNEMNLGGNNDWTIRNVYQSSFEAIAPGIQQPDDREHWALTRHNMENLATLSYNELETLSIVDGLGQAIQVKKKHFMDGTTLVWQISGKETKDALGRVVKSYLPTTEPFGLQNTAYQSTPTPPPFTSMDYDHRDRQKSITNALGHTTDFFYDIDGGLFVNEVVNPENQSQKTYTDTRGRKVKTIQNGQITTEFYHNAVNELVKVRNTKGYETKYEYDRAGRRVKEMHPDRGTTTFAYNNMGQVTQKQTANLMLGSAGSIEYAYNYHRLTNITYPDRPENNVEYVYGTSGNQTGKIVLQKDATGIQWFRYGMLGELTFAGRAIAVAGKTSYWFTTSWEYDSWNRIHKITYPDHEEVTYKYDPAGQLKAVESDYKSNVQGAPNTADIVTNITYNQYGERQRIDYGNGTFTEYDYDDLRRMDELKHTFSTHDIFKQYTYDKVSNVIKIATDPSQNLNIMPTNGELAGPLEHNYTYDDFNRLIKADGWYVGPDDEPGDLLRQEYTLDMRYDESHNILNKAQNHLRGSGDPNDTSIFLNNLVPEAMEDTAYNLDYEDYASGSFTTGGHSYVQPHAPRTIVEYPYGAGADEPSAKRKLLDYDANGNLLLVEQEISDPEDPLGKAKISLLENLWDEENRLLAVDLKPEAPSNKPEVAAYTYDASGERTIKYLPGRLDAYYSAKAAGSTDRLEAFLYPSPLLTVKTLPLPEEMNEDELQRKSITKYTKHYYIGTERIASALGTMHNLGLLCENVWPGSQDIVEEMGDLTLVAGNVLTADYDAFEKELQLPEPFLYRTYLLCVTGDHEPDHYDAYWYHPDHLGSSSYITNTSGEVSQHMEYLPFGETLVEEHLNSYNSPFKFNAKEYDAETGWYYYGARYYNPKWSIWLGVDPLAEMYPSMSPYAYTLQNPIRYIDPTGMVVENSDCGLGCKLNKFFNSIFHPKEPTNPNTGRLSSRYSRGTGMKLKNKDSQSPSSSSHSSQQAISSIEQYGIIPTSLNLHVDNNIPPCNCNPNNSIRIDDREIGIAGPTDISFEFGNIGSTAHSYNTGSYRNQKNRINPLRRNQEDNLRAIAQYLKAQPEATVRFQYPAIPSSFHPNAQKDLRAVYGMSFLQITNYLKKQGVKNLNQRVLRSNGTGFGVFITD